MRKKPDEIPAINNRVKDLRAALKLSQRAFAEGIGYTTGTIGAIEIGLTRVERRFVVVVGAIYNVNTEWLETGNGEMFVTQPPAPPKSNRELAEQYLLEKFRALPPELREDVVAFCNAIIADDVGALKKRLDVCLDLAGESNVS